MSRLVSACATATLAMLCMGSAHAGITPENEIFQVRMASRGDTYRGTIAIRNHGNTVTAVKLYQTDYAFSADGHNSFAKPGGMARSNAAWLRIDQEQITVAPGEIGTVEYEVHVPDDSRLTGSYWSVVMAQEVEGAEATGDSRPQVKLRQTVRHAIQVITEIGETGRSEVAFRNARLTNESGKRLLCIDLENTGERWLRTDVWLELHDAQGRNVGRFAGSQRRTFPGMSVRNRIELTAAPPGKYVALLVADGGRNDLFGTQIELDLR